MSNLRKKSPGRFARRGRERHVRRLRLEALERRDCPAVMFDFVQGDEGGVLTITGDEEDNSIAISRSSHSGGMNVLLGDGSVRTFENVAEIIVNARGGDDAIDARLLYLGTGEANNSVKLNFYAGAGNDQVTIDD